MPKQFKMAKTIRLSAGRGHKATRHDVARLRETMRRHVETDDIPELKGTELPVRRDATGNLPNRPLGTLRRAILESLDYHGMTRYELWKKCIHIAGLSREQRLTSTSGARETLGLSASRRSMAAANLKVVGQHRRKPNGTTPRY